MSTFVIDYPYLDMDKNRRLGYRLRIRSILPEYMKGTDFSMPFMTLLMKYLIKEFMIKLIFYPHFVTCGYPISLLNKKLIMENY